MRKTIISVQCQCENGNNKGDCEKKIKENENIKENYKKETILCISSLSSLLISPYLFYFFEDSLKMAMNVMSNIQYAVDHLSLYVLIFFALELFINIPPLIYRFINK